MSKCKEGLECSVSTEELRSERPVGYCSILGKLYTDEEMAIIEKNMASARKSIHLDENPQKEESESSDSSDASSTETSTTTKTTDSKATPYNQENEGTKTNKEVKTENKEVKT